MLSTCAICSGKKFILAGSGFREKCYECEGAGVMLIDKRDDKNESQDESKSSLSSTVSFGAGESTENAGNEFVEFVAKKRGRPRTKAII